MAGVSMLHARGRPRCRLRLAAGWIVALCATASCSDAKLPMIDAAPSEADAGTSVSDAATFFDGSDAAPTTGWVWLEEQRGGSAVGAVFPLPGFEPETAAIPVEIDQCQSWTGLGCGGCGQNDVCGLDGCVGTQSAGTIVLEGQSFGSISVARGANGRYFQVLGDVNLFDEGDVINVSAPGGGHPSFAGSVAAPADVRLVLPLLSSTPSLSVRAGDGVPVVWEVAAYDEAVVVSLSLVAEVSPGVYSSLAFARCFPAESSDGFFVTPAVLSAITAGLPLPVLGFLYVERSRASYALTDAGRVQLYAMFRSGGMLRVEP